MFERMLNWITDISEGVKVDPTVVFFKAEFIRNMIIELETAGFSYTESAYYRKNSRFNDVYLDCIKDGLGPYEDMIRSIKGRCVGDLNLDLCLESLISLCDVEYFPRPTESNLSDHLESLLVLNACVIPEAKYKDIDVLKMQIIDFSLAKLSSFATKCMLSYEDDGFLMDKDRDEHEKSLLHKRNYLDTGKLNAKASRIKRTQKIFLSLYPNRQHPHSQNYLYKRLAKEWAKHWPDKKIPVKNTLLGYLKELKLIK